MKVNVTARTAPRRRWWWPALHVRIALLWALLMAPLLGWGLPDKRLIPLLFGGGPPWPASRYNLAQDLERLRARAAGADTDLNPVGERARLVDLTPDEAARAEILRRYLLYSRQPDEHIVFRALQRMSPRRLDFDPRLYQYGGAYIYLVGASLGAAGLTGYVTLTSDGGWYLEHPDAFAHFYVVARMVSLAGGALALVAVFRLARRAGGSRTGWIAMVCVALTPVFITSVLEAKPHVLSAALILWATLAALEYRSGGRLAEAVRMGLLAGGAAGLVLTGVVAAALWPAVLLGIRFNRRQALPHLALAAVLALGVYVATNPYVPYNLLFNRAALGDNLDNSWAMYADTVHRAGEGFVRAIVLLAEGIGWGLLAAGAGGLVVFTVRRWRTTLIAVAAGVAMLALCSFMAAGKPAEFARFLILPALLLAIAGAWVLGALLRRHLLLGVPAILIVLWFMPTGAYVNAFAQDAALHGESRFAAGLFLERYVEPGDEIGVLQEPAPYAVPPLDFAQLRVWLLPAAPPPELESARLPEWLVFTADDAGAQAGAWWHRYYDLARRFPPERVQPSRIAWANKPVFVYQRRGEDRGLRIED